MIRMARSLWLLLIIFCVIFINQLNAYSVHEEVDESSEQGAIERDEQQQFEDYDEDYSEEDSNNNPYHLFSDFGAETGEDGAFSWHAIYPQPQK